MSAIGLGCMGFSQSYPPFPDKKDAIATIRKAVEIGISYIGRLCYETGRGKISCAGSDRSRLGAGSKGFDRPDTGNQKVSRIEENIGCLNVKFTPDELATIREKLDSIEILGARYPVAHQKLVK